MKVTRRQFVKGGVAAFTVTFAAPEFLSDLARAQGAHVRNLVVLYLSGGNDSLSMLAPYNDPFYYEPAADAGDPRRPGAADRHRLVEGRARAAPAPHRPQADLRSGTARVHPAHRLRKPEPLALHRHRHLVDRRSEQLAGARLGRALSRLAAVAGGSAGRLEHHREPAARAAGAYRGAGDRQPGRLRVLEPELRRRSGGGAIHGGAHRVARAGRSARARVRLRQHAGGARDARSRRDGGELHGRRPRIRTPASRRRCRRWPAR